MSTCKRMWTDREIRSLATNSVENKENLKVFENIVDKDGHKRFLEGDIAIETITGVTKTYGKWSLSGTHLMIVICLELTDNISSVTLANLDIPKWIKDKIVAVAGSNVTSSSFTAWSADTSTNVTFYGILKKSSNDLYIVSSCNINAITRYTRIQYDLLIDDE